ncbi:MAG TPA: L-threonylcarbamoyladenylate synthase, partial [Sphingomicrobium sp.]
MTKVLPFGDAAIAEAAALIERGEPVAIATETVYGLAADATSAAAVARIYEAKGRPSFNPLIVHVADLAAARTVGEFSDDALRLAKQHWPGPLTLVVPLLPGAPIASLVTAGLPTIGLRVPAHRAMQALLRAAGKPLAAPSANASGSISPTRAAHVLSSLGGKIALIVDDGPCERGIESTIVGATGRPLRLLRPGPIAIAADPSPSGQIESPGQMASHYAPSKPLRLDAAQPMDDEFLIGFGPVAGNASLSPAGDLIEAASRLFDL